MKIERDKWYVMRNGEKVRVVCVDAPGDYPVLAIYAFDSDILSFKATGEFDVDVHDHPLDLISEYREPARVWVNIFGDGSGYSYPDKKRAEQNAIGMGYTRIAVEFVEVVK